MLSECFEVSFNFLKKIFENCIFRVLNVSLSEGKNFGWINLLAVELVFLYCSNAQCYILILKLFIYL